MDQLWSLLLQFNNSLSSLLIRADAFLLENVDVDLNTVLSTALIGLIPVIAVVAWFSRPSIPSAERRFLRDLFEQTNGRSWIRSHGWHSLDRWWWDPTVCYGLIFEDGHIVEIDLYKNNLVGSIPSSIGAMTRLEALRLGGNVLRGEIPREVGLCRNGGS